MNGLSQFYWRKSNQEMSDVVYGECAKHPGNSMVGCPWCRLEEGMIIIKMKSRNIKIDKILKENELHRREDSKEGES